MNLQKLLMLAQLAAAVSATTAPTLGKVLGFGHSAAYAQDQGEDDNTSGDDDSMGDEQ